MRKSLGAIGLAIAVLAVCASSASATNFRVDDDNAQCANADFNTVQAAVNAASPGDQIRVCSGTYQEQVTLDETKDNITIVGQPSAIIQPAVGFSGAVFTVDGAKNVKLNSMQIQGNPAPGVENCATPLYGVLVIGGGDLRMNDDSVLDIREENSEGDISGCQKGFAILVGRFSANQIGSLTLRNSAINGYQKAGVIVSGGEPVGQAGDSVGVLKGNTITGAGPIDTIAQNGVQASDYARLVLQNNTISDHKYSPSPLSSGVILLNLPGGVTIGGQEPGDTGLGNTVTNNDNGIFTLNVDNSTIAQNTITGSDYGLALSWDSDPSSDPTQYSQNNKVIENSATGSTSVDCYDDSTGTKTAGTANRWTDDIGEIDDPEGLCEPPGPPVLTGLPDLPELPELPIAPATKRVR